MQIDTQTDGGMVIIVTPDEAERNRLTSILRNAGYTVQYATCETLIEEAAQGNPCLIIMDADYQVAPDPLPTLNALYADARTRDVPVMLLTAAFGGFDVTKWFKPLEGRRIPFFRKQYTPEHLIWYIGNFFKALQE